MRLHFDAPRPTRADFARCMVNAAGKGLIFFPREHRTQPIKTGRLV